MKILLTGGTGFLGKRVLKILCEDARIERVDVVTRRKLRSPYEKCRMIRLDLADPACLNDLSDDVDAVLHLAGLYDFQKSLEEDYSENVMITLNLLEKVRLWNRQRRVPIYYTSTYGVGFGQTKTLKETALEDLPSKSIPYAYTKAVAERALTDAKVPGAIFRLGALIGPTDSGEIEKIDGPYMYMKLLHDVASIPLAQKITRIPVPADPDGILPLVPADCAANALVEGVFRLPSRSGTTAEDIFGVYNSKSVVLRDFCKTMISEFLPNAHPFFVKYMPELVMRHQEKVTGIPEAVFRFSIQSFNVRNDRFLSVFGDLAVPQFEKYQKAFFKGFKDYMSGHAHSVNGGES